MESKILVSACLLGFECAFDGFSRKNEKVMEFCADRRAIAVCPEISGGLPCPKERCEISGGDGEDVLSGRAIVVSVSGADRTCEFISGAETVLKTAKDHNCKLAILKEYSPSCASICIHAGKFDNTTIPGRGVTAAMFDRSGIRVISDTVI